MDGSEATSTSDGSGGDPGPDPDPDDDPGPDPDGPPSGGDAGDDDPDPGSAVVDLADVRADLTVAAAAALGTVGVTALSTTSTLRAGTVARLVPLAGYVGYRLAKGRGGPLSAVSTWVAVSLALGVGTVVALVVA